MEETSSLHVSQKIIPNMLSTASPLVPLAPLAPNNQSRKRDRPHDDDEDTARPKPRMPFIVDDDDSDDSDDENAQSNQEPLAKKLMVHHHPSVNEEAPITVGDDDDGSTLQDKEQPTNEVDKDTAPAPFQSLTSFSWRSASQTQPSATVQRMLNPVDYTMTTCRGQTQTIKERSVRETISYDNIVAARSKTKEGRAKRSYYGIDIHELMATCNESTPKPKPKPKPTQQAAEPPVSSRTSVDAPQKRPQKSLMWTEKYRARNFMDLCGDDGTNRTVLRWLKKWDPIVFPGAAKPKPVSNRRPGGWQEEEEKPHRKILLLTGPPGLGKTTLAHVCAKQAGYEVMEINASDDRSRDVVKNRIRTSLGTESVKNVANKKDADGSRRVAKPACVIVDEVDGVVTGSGPSGEGGFVKALIDLVLTDQRNSSPEYTQQNTAQKKKRKGDDFRLLRPLILICNDVYHPSLRPLRQSNLAEIIHVGRPTLDSVVGRLKAVFDKEGIPCDKDASRKLCEAAWGMTSGIDAKRGAESAVEGDLRGVMVVGEWVAGRFRSAAAGGDTDQRLTRQWIEKNIIYDLASGAAGSRGLGRGSTKDIVSRLFQEGGGFPKQAMDLSETKHVTEQPTTELGFNEFQKKHAMDRLRQMVETNGEISHIMTEIMAEYPNREYNDDCYLHKPNQAYDWFHFHDSCQSRLYSSQDWELAPYLSQPVLACHHLFASPKRHYANFGGAGGYDKRWGANDADANEPPPVPFSGPRADYQANEAEKVNRSMLQAMQSQLSPSLMRYFRSAEDMATDFLPYLSRLVSPDVKPVVVGGSQGSMASVRKDTERTMVRNAAEVLAELNIQLVKGTIESKSITNRTPEFVYRMEPDIDALCSFETAATLLSSQAPVRYAVRQVLDQELRRTIIMREKLARQARFKAGHTGTSADLAAVLPQFSQSELDKENILGKAEMAVKKDFFGRIIEAKPLSELDRNIMERNAKREQEKVWVTFHEGLNNAVRKPITFSEFLKAL